MAQAHVRCAHPLSACAGRRGPGEVESWPAIRLVDHFDLPKREPLCGTRAQRLEAGFLGRKPGSQRLRPVGAFGTIGQLAAGENALLKALPEPRHRAGDASRGHHVDPYAENHVVPLPQL